MIPTFILTMWLLGLLSLALLGAAIYLAYEWQERSWGWNAALQSSVFDPRFGNNEATWLLVAAVILFLLTILGDPFLKGILKIVKPVKQGDEPDPRIAPRASAQKRLLRPDGSELHLEFYGPEDGIPIVLTHGWSLHSGEWNYLKRELADRFRLIVWDEPGLGQSKRPSDRDYSMENLARDLEAVLAEAGDKPAFLLGHSIGGMISLTWCRLYPAMLNDRVIGLILTHTTPLNPVRTTAGASFLTAIEKPVLYPLMYVTIALSPLIWLMNWLSYWNGSAHISAMLSSYGGTETWQQIDFAARFTPHGSPAVLARGMLGMMKYDAREVLSGISVPTLVIAGDRDSVTKPEASELMRDSIPNAKLKMLTPARHMGLIEHHATYSAEVRKFVNATMAKHKRQSV